MFGDGALSFREFAMGESLPLATIHAAVLEFLRGRDDAVLFGAQAVYAYVDESRMTQAVDVMSPRARELAEEIRGHLNARFHIAVRVRGPGPSGSPCIRSNDFVRPESASAESPNRVSSSRSWFAGFGLGREAGPRPGQTCEALCCTPRR